ncbi:MATE family efflux transporter [Vibrio ulleungensis]|uniref:Multidrug resistance protein NorM n=1 Tax=Vibrio ulleungensis TaxID=2807619 RepID=A0ABS2HLC5_9VIBR|nr:MATE family efflux transporter [Vibrio ulleungensis]MBM7036672.1 MATE family efflux transporter [Vibrio ulleungensis]
MTQQAKFVEGSTMKHILTMTGAGSIGLMALFVVDLLDMMFISMLGQVELAAAIGFAGTLMFFTTSISIGTSIAMGALVSKAIGAKQTDDAQRLVTHILLSAFVVNSLMTAVVMAYSPQLLALLGAKGEAAYYAQAYLNILLPSTPIMAMGMASGAALRAAGDAKLSMWSTLIGGIVNAVLDPLFIFGFGWGVEGAATASVISRITVFVVAFAPLIRIHQLVGKIEWNKLQRDIRPIFAIALPAILTNTATPIGNAIVTSSIAEYGENYVAGIAVIGRVTPVAFALIFALSGAVGPIIGQNYGAERIDRVSDTLKNSLIVTGVYCTLVSLLLYLLQGFIISSFSLTGDAATVIVVFCSVVAFTFIFNGIQFVANASFNNLGKPLYSTFLNMSKATLGTLPFVYFGSQWFGAIGVIYGQALGNVVFGILAYLLLKKHIGSLFTEQTKKQQQADDIALQPVCMQPFCSHDAMVVDELPKEAELLSENK